MSTPKHRAWTLGTGDAESLVAEARKALFVMVGFLAILWLVQIVNVADHYSLDVYGIQPHVVRSLPYLLTAPFLHVSFTHIESNSGPLFIFGFLAAYRGVPRFLWLTGLVIITSGLTEWISGMRGTTGVGASGVVFGYLGYILVRGIFDRHGIDILIGAVMALCFAYQFTVLLPQAGIGWQDHIGGLVGGVAGGWLFRDRTAARGRSKSPATSGAPTSSPGAAGSGATGPLPARAIAGGPVPGSPAPGGAVLGSAVATPAATVPSAAKQKERDTSVYSGPRADLHRQLDDLGL
ncbi:MAG TPA: rhomboid family intramembrane serine protease [Streptosporangiaceae bacterium]|nr:rhomboid family intramembrane serine protease [Streptosporangiaceae bacterium]